MEEEIELDEFHAHEAMDRMFLIVDMFNSYVFEHPYVEQNPELVKKAEELSDNLYAFYNSVAAEIIKDEDTAQG